MKKKRTWRTRKYQCTAALTEFWRRVNDGEARLPLLLEFSLRIVGPSLGRPRAKTHRLPLGKPCWACRRGQGWHRHHVIQVQYGGVTTRHNLVVLCVACHAEIHPYLPVEVPEPVDVFKWLPKD